MDNGSVNSNETESTEYKLAELAKSLKEGVEIRDRKWRAKTYPTCFLRNEAVEWMMKTANADESAAVDSLNSLREAGYISHVVDPHKRFKVGQTKKLYFRFVEDHPKPRKRNTWTNKQQFLSSKDVEACLQGSDDWKTMKTKMDRMASSITQLTETQLATQTKLEIVHQATISLIEAMISTALLLLVLLVYTLLVLAPSLHQTTGVFVVSSLLGTILISAFVIRGRRLFSVWLALDTCVVEAAEGEDVIDDYEMAMTATPTEQESRKVARPRMRGMGARQRSSIILKESPLLPTVQPDKETPVEQIQQRQASDLPDPSDWPHRPVLVCVNTPVSKSLTIDEFGTGPCPIGKPFRFSSDLFEGQCLVRLRNIPNSDSPEGDSAYFDGRRRLFQTIVQGRFKEPLSLNEVLTGHEFVKPLLNLPHPWILKAATNLIGKLAPGANIRVAGDQPTMLASLAATSQVVRGDEPGNEPDIASAHDEIQEDCSMLGGKFSSGKISAGGRKLHLASPKRAQQYTFDTETVYTFDFYQSLLNVATYSLDLGVANINIGSVLNGQPIQSLCKTTDGRYLWSFQIWHECLLPPDLDSSNRSGKSDDSQHSKKSK